MLHVYILKLGNNDAMFLVHGRGTSRSVRRMRRPPIVEHVDASAIRETLVTLAPTVTTAAA